MCDCHSIPECCVVFSGVKLSIRSFNLLHYITVTLLNNSVDYPRIIQVPTIKEWHKKSSAHLVF